MRTPQGTLLEMSFLWEQKYTSSEICYLEMRAVLRFLQACQSSLQDQHLTLWTDNISVMVCINKKSSRSRQLMIEYRAVYNQLRLMRSTVQAKYIDTKSNWHADQLSRANDPQDYGWSVALFLLAQSLWMLTFTVDCFASRRFHQQILYHSRFHDEQADIIDTFSTTWRRQVCWLTPPLSLIGDSLQKVASDQCLAVLVAPEWLAQPWSTLLRQLTVSSHSFNVNDYLESSKCNLAQAEALRNPRWRWKLWLLNGSKA